MKKLLIVLSVIPLIIFVLNTDHSIAAACDGYSGIPSVNLQRGSSNSEAIKQLQCFLITQTNQTALTLNDLTPNGFGTFGPRTQAALAQIQAQYGLNGSNGYYYGAQTQNAWQNAYELNPSSNNSSSSFNPSLPNPSVVYNNPPGFDPSSQDLPSAQTLPDSWVSGSNYPAPQNSPNPPVNVNQMTASQPPQTSSFFKFKADPILLAQYQASGDCQLHSTYRNCRSNPSYWTHSHFPNISPDPDEAHEYPTYLRDDIKYPRRCGMVPVIAYLRDQLPTSYYFSWTKINSDCRTEVVNENANSSHLSGRALDIGGIPSVNTGKELILELQKPENNILGLTLIIFNAEKYTKNSDGIWAGPFSYHGGPGKCKNSDNGADDCHYSHIHVQVL